MNRKTGKLFYIWLPLLILFLFITGCGKKEDTVSPTPAVSENDAVLSEIPENTPTYMAAPSPTPSSTPEISDEYVQKTVCIDPGHQEKANNDQEPIGPGSDITKARVSAGATGVSTKIEEYRLTLTVSLLLKEELEKRGYEVVMTRTSNDVNISNKERAEIATDANADVFIRIHADSATGNASGAMTMCQSASNPFTAYMYEDCHLLSQCILDCFVAATDALSRGVTETDSMSGINWSTMPVTILEMGFLSNPSDDALMSDPDYQAKMVKGIADGIDLYFMEKDNQ